MALCNNCGSGDNTVLFPKVPGAGSKGAYDIVRCKQCGLVFTDIGSFNPDDYYNESYYKTVYPDYLKDKKVHLINARSLLKKIGKYFNTGSLCEIGSAYGFFLNAARDEGWDVCGYEVSDYSRDYSCRELDLAVEKDFLSAGGGSRFDFICMNDTIEHLTDPFAVLGKCRDVLNPGGGLMITTGDIGSLHSKLFGKRWRLLTPPLHLYFYSRETLSYLLEKHGFEILYMGYGGKYFNIFSIMEYIFRIKSAKFPVLPIKINTFDVLTVIARKTGQKS